MLMLSDGRTIIKFQDGAGALATLERQPLTPGEDIQEITRRCR